MATVKRNEKAKPKENEENNDELQNDPFPGSVKDELTGKYKLPKASD